MASTQHFYVTDTVHQWSSTFFVQLPAAVTLAENRPYLWFFPCQKILFWFENIFSAANEISSGSLVSTNQNEIKCIWRINVIHLKKSSWYQQMRTLRWCLSASFFKAGRKLVSLSHMAFPRVLFTSRRLRYLLRMCGVWLKPCSGKCVVENASNYSFTFP